MDTPVLTDVTVDLGAGVSDVYPTRIPDLFAGEQLVLFGRYAAPGERAVTLHGRVGETAVTFTYPAKLADTPGPDFLPRLWAHRKVAFLLDEIRLHGSNKELVDEVVRLATKFAIVTPYTSALVVEDGEPRLARFGTGRGGARAPEETEQVHPSDAVARRPTVRDAASSDHGETDDDLPTEESLGEGGISDAPFEGPPNNGLIGLGGGAGGSFQGRGGHRNLRTGGGGRKTDDCVEDALKWLAAHQSPDGGWLAKDFGGWCDGRPAVGPVVPGAGRAERDVAVTALSLLAFLGAGYTNRSEGPFGHVVGKGLKYLRNAQDAEGCFGARTHDGWLEDHAIAATAIVEAYGLTGSSLYKGAAQKALDFLANVRPPSSVWSRGSADGAASGAGDSSTTAWASLCLADVRRMNAADGRAGKPPSLEGYDRRADETLAWLVKAGEAGDATAAVAALFLALQRPQAAPDAENVRAAERLSSAPAPSIGVPGIDFGRGQWATLAIFQAGGEAWARWQREFVRGLVDASRHDGDFCTTKGSFDPSGADAEAFGRVGSTALAALSLEVYYRYERGGVASPPSTALLPNPVSLPNPAPRPTPVVPGAAPAAPPPSSAPTDATGESVELQRRKDASTAPVDGQKVRSVAGRTFRLDAAGRYVDTTYDAKATLGTDRGLLARVLRARLHLRRGLPHPLARQPRRVRGGRAVDRGRTRGGRGPRRDSRADAGACRTSPRALSARSAIVGRGERGERVPAAFVRRIARGGPRSGGPSPRWRTVMPRSLARPFLVASIGVATCLLSPGLLRSANRSDRCDAAPEPPPPAPERPLGETVPAKRYRVFAVESALEMTHGGGKWIEEFWLPDAKVVANVEWEWETVPEFREYPRVTAFFSDRPRNWSQTSGLETPVETPVEDVALPKALADRFVALAKAARDVETERRALGPLLLGSGVATTAGTESQASGHVLPPLPPAVVSPVATAWLAGFAEAVGAEVDPVTRFPKRIRRTKDGGEMVLVPRGEFLMGYEPDDARGGGAALASTAVDLSKPFFLDASEVTVAQWKRFAKDGGPASPAIAADAPDAAPVGDVTHGDAAAFARWAGAALPTEAQWERAARASRRFGLYPTDDYHDEAAQRNGAGNADGFVGAAPVRSFPANGWGFFDLGGNVAEWCADGYAPFVESKTLVTDPVGPADAPERVIKGGSWLTSGAALSIGHREHAAPSTRRPDLGFRCAKALP